MIKSDNLKNKDFNITSFFNKVTKEQFNSKRDHLIITVPVEVHAALHDKPKCIEFNKGKQINSSRSPSPIPFTVVDNFDKIEYLGEVELNGTEDVIQQNKQIVCEVRPILSVQTENKVYDYMDQKYQKQAHVEVNKLEKELEAEESSKSDFDCSFDDDLVENKTNGNRILFNWNSRLR